MISANLRHLKIIAGDYQLKSGLCAACGKSGECSIEVDSVTACNVYQPVIPFKSFAGTESRFNTFRLGGAWFNRVRAGQSIGLIDRFGEKAGEAVVESVHCGDKDQMLQDHAAYNHLILAKPHADPAVELRRLIRNLYGPNFLAKAPAMTVIYMNRSA